jgi:hypothetical protein
MSDFMKKFTAVLILLACYALGIAVSWSLPKSMYGWSIPLVMLWVYATTRFHAYLMARFGWTKKKGEL